ncbi:MAG: Gfo/Idh/MocA family oxidoreductase [Planctomycetes bacterium]|nr:Gfo/Idh/MocA family oxidoreductase [Planctomycetota bacterium]
MNDKKNLSRRSFIKASATTAAGVSLVGLAGCTEQVKSTSAGAFASGSDKIRVGLIGCGGRGTGAMANCVKSSPGIEVYAMGDVFQDRLDGSVKSLKNYKPDGNNAYSGNGVPPEVFNVPKERRFVGFDAFEKVIATDCDMVILATPPHFRPQHLKAAIEAGKHVFMEKPVAVDPVGIRSVIESSNIAKRKSLAIVAGTQRRHQKHYIELIKRVKNGDIGDIVSGQCYWNMGTLWSHKRQPGWSDMEYQLRNWLYYTWLSGDHIVEQHVHNIDVINWAIGANPVKCMGMGGRQVRTEPIYGNVFDHFAVEFEYPNGVKVISMCRQTKGCTNNVSEMVVGTKGTMHGDEGITGARAYKYGGPNLNPYVEEHAHLIASIRSGRPLNEGKRIAESTLCAIMGRMSAYTGRAMKFDWAMKASKLKLGPDTYEFGDLEMVPVSVPGKTPLI